MGINFKFERVLDIGEFASWGGFSELISNGFRRTRKVGGIDDKSIPPTLRNRFRRQFGRSGS